MKSSLTFLLLLTLRLNSHAQDFEEKPLEREQQFHQQRKFADGSLPELWQQFVASRTKNLNKITSVPSAYWYNLGPDGMDSVTGRMTCHSFNPYNSQIILAGASSGGIWKSYNGGDTWQVLSDKLPSLWISAIAINPSDTNHILMGTGFYMGPSITLQPGIGVLESFDGGNTWNPNSFAYPFSAGVSVNRIIWDKTNLNNVYLATTNGLWVSRDMGMNWTSPLAGGISDLDLVTTSTNILYASVHSAGIYQSTDSANTWVQLTNGLPASSSVHRITLDVCDSFPQFIVASIINPTDFSVKGVYKTSDGGNFWSAMTGIPNFAGVTATVFLGWYVNMVDISPIDTNIIFLGSCKLFLTDNCGVTWAEKDYYPFFPTNGPYTGIVHPDIWDLGFQPDNPSIVYCFNDGGVNKSYDNGNYWLKKNKNLVTAQIYQLSSFRGDTVRIIAGLQDNGLHYLDNTGGNISWKLWGQSDGCSVAYDPNNPNKVYGDYPNGNHKKSSNVSAGIGASTNFNSGIVGINSNPFHFALAHHPTLSNILYTSNDTRIFKSTNGTSWTTAATISNIKSIEISENNPSTIYASAFAWSNINSHSFYISYDDGANWTPTTNSPGWRVTDIEADPNNYGTVYATQNSPFIANPHVYKSTDHGDTWTSVGSGLPDVPTNAITVNPYNSDVVYVATDLGVYISEDAGLSWNDYNDNLPQYIIMDMHYHKMDSTLRIGTLGRGVWKTKSIPSSFTGINTLSGNANAIVNIYPNPFTFNIFIELNVSKTSHFTISILNTLGQEIKLLHNGLLQNGKQTIQWSGNNSIGKNCSNETYYLEIKNKSIKRTYKIIKSN
ncbi:MAG: T9SS type A sorting domain-containing protein [Saprospiraceae bacterium]|nr:T9SS type A sorting domain-containing protein [Saprospiraceae bacterium]